MSHGRVRAFVGLGGNVGGEAAVSARFDAACRALSEQPGVQSVRRAARYRTAPVGPVREQPEYFNSVALVLLRGFAPVDFLRELLALEARLGRDRSHEPRFGARPIDLDLLLWDDLVLDEPGPPPLVLPHPRLVERAFALAPLAELAGDDLIIPGARGGRVADLLAAALADPAQAVVRLDERDVAHS